MITSHIESNQTAPDLKFKTALRLKEIGKKYGLAPDASLSGSRQDFWVLKEISFAVNQGEILGIIGRNGAGKTTLLNIVVRALSPSEGSLEVGGRALGLFNLGVGFQDELSGKENIFLNGTLLGATKRELEAELQEIIDFSELGDFISMPLGTYSQGMRLRLGFSIVVNLAFDILVVDEVLAVGDSLFQSKCFQRLMDFKRAGKTLIITSQSMDLIERLCDRVVLLDHGKVLFQGSPPEGINRYRALMNTEKFFVGPQKKETPLIKNTKRWVDDKENWGKQFGTKEVEIEKVEFLNRFGFRCIAVKSGQPLRVKANFRVKNKVKDPHFGVAIFREDGVYCYGPNTEFDGIKIPELNPGRGYFTLDYRALLLAPGNYKVSIAIWDKNEALAFDHHYGYYDLVVTGFGNKKSAFLNMPFKISRPGLKYGLLSFFTSRNDKVNIDLDLLQDKFGQTIDGKNIRLEYVKFLDRSDNEKEIFMTNKSAKAAIGLDFKKLPHKGLYLWLGIYRDDEIYCQGVTVPLKDCKRYNIVFPRLPLLPGFYNLSLGIWDHFERKFLTYHHGVYPLKMVFDKQDHGTIYLEHKWRWEVS